MSHLNMDMLKINISDPKIKYKCMLVDVEE